MKCTPPRTAPFTQAWHSRWSKSVLTTGLPSGAMPIPFFAKTPVPLDIPYRAVWMASPRIADQPSRRACLTAAARASLPLLFVSWTRTTSALVQVRYLSTTGCQLLALMVSKAHQPSGAHQGSSSALATAGTGGSHPGRPAMERLDLLAIRLPSFSLL